MIRSMFAAVAGLRSHQTMMDTVGNNIANVNTTGFKRSRVLFQDILSQTVQGAGAPNSELGGTNPAQIGLGVRVGSIATHFAQGALQRTGRPMDVAIEGDGFFVLDLGGEQLFTRSGAFFIDESGDVVSAAGGRVQGWRASAGGIIDTTQPTAMNDVTTGGPGFVAVGDVGTSWRPAVWLSVDGTVWTQLPDTITGGSSGVEGGESIFGRMTLVAAGEPGLVAVSATADFGWPSFADPVLWTSTDGFK